jgi:hypothetical protein
MANHLVVLLTIGCLSAAPVAAAAQSPPSHVPELTQPAIVGTPVISSSPEAPTPAKVPEPCPDERSYRELARHIFLPSHLLSDPFSYSAFGLFWGVGAGNATGPTLDAGRPPSLDFTNTKQYPYTGLGLGLALNVRILEYLSVWASMDGRAYLGTNGGSLLVVGTNARFSGSLGVKGSLPVGEHLRLSASVQMDYGPVFTALIASGLIEAVRSGQISTDEFLQSNDATTWAPGATAAYAPFAFLGVTGNVRLLFPTGGGNVVYASNGIFLAAMADFDFKPLVQWLPLGVNGVYSIVSPFGFAGSTTQEYGFGLYYTGQKAVAVGVEVDWRRGRIDNGLVALATLAWLNLRYYWGN